MSFAAGDTFLNTPARGAPTHLWLIISDPELDPDQVLIVNVATWREGEDASCRLGRGEHSFIKHDSYVNYYDAKVVSELTLRDLETKRLINWQSPLSTQLLAKVRKGALNSPLLALAKRQILDDQDLI